MGDILPTGLREKDREILLLFFEKSLSNSEIAQRLNITEGTSYTKPRDRGQER